MRPVSLGLVYQVEDSFPFVFKILISRKGISPFSSLSIVNFRDGCKLFMDVSVDSILSTLMSRMMSSMYLVYSCGVSLMVSSNWLI